MSVVPIVDISNPTATSMDSLDRACRDHGFFLLKGHGYDDLIERMWSETARLFDSDAEVREPIRRAEGSPFGYNDRELTKRKRDHKQVFDYGSPAEPIMERFNAWPELAGFKSVMAEFHDSFGALADKTVELVHAALNLSPEGRSAIAGDAGRSSVRLNHYPVGDPVPETERSGLADLGPTALGYHTDPGVLTLLLQDSTGGLQTQTRSGEWIDVEPQPGTVVVNLADAMQVWTNDQYIAAVHRVVPMTHERRFSIPFFFNPVKNAVIEPLQELCTESAHYRAFEWKEFMQARNDDNFADAGGADTQISDYLVGA